jgi:uncharacterized membrane protein
MTELISMYQVLSIPNWSEVHPVIIHFPIVLLLIAPFFIVAAILMSPEDGRPYLIAAFALMLLGTVSTFMAVASGEAAAQVAERTPAASQVLVRHAELAHTAQIVFALLTLIFGTILFLPRLLKRAVSTADARILPLAFLVLYAAGAIVLVNTAHNGARLVHEFGVHANLAQTNQPDSDATRTEAAVEEANAKR